MTSARPSLLLFSRQMVLKYTTLAGTFLSLGSSKKLRKRKITDGYDRREGRGLVHIHIISSEANTQMGKILVSEGGRIEIGSVVGLLGADGDAVDLERVPPARIAVDMPKASVVEPFDDDLEDD